MSTRLMAKCWPITGLTILQKAVLISLADQANDQGFCWPSVGTICERVCGSERAVQEAIRGLISVRLLQREFREGKPTFYKVTPAEYAPHTGADAAPLTPADGAGVPPQEMHPADSATPADDCMGGVRDLPLGGAGFAGITVKNRKRTVKTITETDESVPAKPAKTEPPKADLDFSGWPSQPAPQVLSDWLKFRKGKRAPVTQTVINGFSKEFHLAAKAGYSVDDCLTEAMMRGWQGFKLEWLQRTNGHANHQRPHERQDTSAAGRVRAAVDRELADIKRRQSPGSDSAALENDVVDVWPQVG